MNLLHLPPELLFCIGNELLLDYATRLCEVQDLRLVCKLFDRMFAPIVLSNIGIFKPWRDIANAFSNISNFNQFCALTNGSDRLCYVQSVRLGPWNWVYEPPEPPSPGPTRAKSSHWKSVLTSPIHGFMDALLGPESLTWRLREGRRRNEVKRWVRSADSVCLQLPNVRRVKWILGSPECRQSVEINLHILETLPSLEELDLTLPIVMRSASMPLDTGYEIGPTMARLRKLCKLTVRLWADHDARGVVLDWLKQVIANNPNLTHLILYQSGTHLSRLPTLSELFDKVPPENPLRLRHLRLSPRFYRITTDILPHIRSLTSLEIRFPRSGDTSRMDSIWGILQSEHIYVSEVHINRVTSGFLNYLRNFCHLEALSLCGSTRDRQNITNLFKILEEHKLRRIKFEPFNWGRWFEDRSSRMSMERYTHLQEVVLHACHRSEYTSDLDDTYQWNLTCRDLLEIALPVACIDSQAPVELVMEGEAILFDEFRGLCRASQSSMVRDLGERVRYRNTVQETWEEQFVFN